MIFSSLEVRDKYHRLSTSIQHTLSHAEHELAILGLTILIEGVDGLVVAVKITDQLVHSTPNVED